MNSLELGDETISKRAQVCLDLYEECHAICVGLDNRLGGKASEEDNHCNDGEAPIASLVENQLGRFNIWTSNIGVFATLKLSLDYRLRDASDIRDLVLRLLDSLFGNLQQLLHVLNRAHLMPASDDNRQRSPPTTALLLSESPSRANISSAINTISDNVDRLHRLSNSIRRAGAESRNMRAAEFEWKDDDGSDLGRPWMEHFAMALLQFKYPESSETIRRRLASAMLLRRKRLLYRQARQEKLVLAAVHASRKKIAPVKKLVASKASSKPGPQQQLNLPNNVETDEPKVAQSVRSFNTAATPLDPEKFQRAVAPSRVSTAKSAPLTEETKLNFPPPPLPIKDGRKEVLCPYCGLLMPVREVENLLTWRNHVLKDLDPYVCLFENCSKENQLYNSVKDWLCHMKFKHRLQWRCAVKVHSKETARIFNLQKDFEDHMKKFHEGTFTEAQLPLLVESSARPVTPIFETCPLCDPKGLQDPERENQLTPDELEKHIINHLVFLAVKSIPWPENVGEAASSNSSARTKTRETIQNDLDHGMQPDFEDITYNSPERLHDDSENFANNIDEIRLHDSYPGHHLDPKLRAFIEKVPISGELLDYLTHLRSSEIRYRREEIEDALPGTCTWLLRHPAHRSWLSKPKSILLIKGKPGSGKSTLLKYALMCHESNKVFSLPLVASYFFSNDTYFISSMQDMLRSLVYQLLSQLRYAPRVPSVNSSLQEVFLQLAREISPYLEVNIYLDAMDECVEGSSAVVELFNDIYKQLHRSASFRICISCRHHPILSELPSTLLSTISVERENAEDIKECVRFRLRRLSEKDAELNLLNLQEDKVSAIVEGNHRWISHTLENFVNQAQIFHPPYGMKLDPLEGIIKGESNGLVSLVCCAKRPLTPAELKEALLITTATLPSSLEGFRSSGSMPFDDTNDESVDQYLVSRSEGFVKRMGPSGASTVRIIHFTARDYVAQKLQEQGINTHATITLACIAYINMKELNDTLESLEINVVKEQSECLTSKFPLLDYALRYWMYHLDSALDHSPNLSYLEICRREEWSEFVSQWISLCHKLSAPMELKPVQGMTLLHVAAKFGLQALASAIITSPETSVGDLNTMDGMRRTPSSYATAGNHGSIVNLLSSRGVDLDVSEVNEGDSVLGTQGLPKEKKDVKIYNATEDAIALADALARNPADCDVLVDILPALSRDQMFDLRSEYEGYCKTEEHDGNLAECIKLRVGGVFGEICYATVLGQYESEGYWVERACSSNLMALSMLGGALFGRPNIEIQEIKDKFRSVKYRSSLTQLVEDRLEVDQARRIALVALAAERQGESDTRPDEYRDSDVDELHRAIDGRYDSQLLWRIMLRSDAQLREVLKEYTRKYRINLPLKILWMSYDPALVIISYILIGVMNRPARDAQSLYDALMALTKSELKESRMSLENDEEWKFQLLASILVRAHWDRRHLKNVKIEYEEKYQSTVELDLVNATTGYFREFCLGLVRTET